MASDVGSRSRGSARQSSAFSGGSTTMQSLNSADRFSAHIARSYAVLFALSQDMSSGKKFPLFVLTIEHLQFLLILFAADIPWAETSVLQHLRSDPSTFLEYQAFWVFLALVMFVFLVTLIALYYLQRNPNFGSKTFKRVLRTLVQLQTTLLFVPIVNMYLTPFDCIQVGNQYVMSAYPEVQCWVWPSLLPACLSAVFLIIFAAFSAGVNLLFFDKRIRNNSPTARPSSRMQTLFLLARLFMLVIFKTVHVNNKAWDIVRVVLYFVSASYLVYRYVQKLPYYASYVNIMTTGWLAASAACSAAALAAVVIQDPTDMLPFVLMAAFFPAGFGFGATISTWRIKLIERWTKAALLNGEARVVGDVNELDDKTGQQAFESDDEDGGTFFNPATLCSAKALVGFYHPDMVEISTRFARVGDAKTHEEEIEPIKALLNLGLQRFPDAVQIYNHYANVLMTYRNDGIQATIQIKQTRKLTAPLDVRFVTYCHERMATQVMQARSLGDGGLDAISFVEFQKQFKLAKHYHLETLQNIKAFWGMLRNDDVDVNHIPALTKKITHSEGKASLVYNSLIQKFPNSKPLLQSYGRFQEDVKRDYDTALACYDMLYDIEEGDEERSAAPGADSIAGAAPVQHRDRDAGASADGSQGVTSGAGTRSSFAALSSTNFDKDALAATRKYRSILLSRKSVAVHRLAWTINFALVFILCFNIAAFVLIDSGVKYHRSMVTFMADAGKRNTYVESAPLYLRYLEEAARANDQAAFEGYAFKLEEDMLAFRDVHQLLYEETYRTTFSSPQLDDRWAAPTIDILVVMNSSDTVVEQLNLWDATNAFINKGLEVAQYSMADILTYNDRATRYLLDNNIAVLNALSESEEILDKQLNSNTTRTLIIQGVFAGVAVMLLFVLAIGFFRPALRKIHTERMQTLRIFMTIPKQVVQRIHKDIKVSVDFDDDGDDDDEATKKDKKDGVGRSAMITESNGNVLSDNEVMRRMTYKYSFALAIIGVAFSAYFLVCFGFWGTGSEFVGNDVRLSGERRDLAQQLHFLIRELPLVNFPPRQVTTMYGQPLDASELRELVRGLADRLRDANYRLKFGDSSGMDRRSQELRSLMYDETCLGTECSEDEVPGLDARLFEYLLLLLRIVNERTEDYTYNNSNIIEASSIEEEDLSIGLQKAVDIIVGQIDQEAVVLFSIEGAVFGGCLIILVLLYLFLFSGMLSHLRAEATKTGSMLLMIPPEIIEKVDAIKTFLESGIVLDESERIQQDLANSRITNAAILNHRAAEALVVIDSAGTIISWNRPAVDLFGWTEQEALGKNVNIIQEEDVKKEHDEYLRRYIETDEKHIIGINREANAVRKNGEVVPVSLSVDEVILSEKRIYAGIIKDLTKLSEAVEKAKNQQQFSDSIISSSSVGIIVSSSTGMIEKFNLQAQKIFGFSESDVIGANLSVLMPDDVGRKHDSYIESYRNTGISRVIGTDRIVAGRRGDGSDIQLLLSVAEVTLGEDSWFAGFVIDQTEKIAQDTRIREEKLFNEAVVDTSTAAIIVMDHKGWITKFNRAACEIFQYKANEVIGHNVKMLMPRRHSEKHDGYLEAYAKTGKKVMIGSVRDMEGQRRDGSEVCLQISVAEVEVDGAVWFAAFLSDETERVELDRKMAEEKLFNEAVVVTSTAGIVVIDVNGLVKKFNGAASRMLQYHEDEVIGQNVKMLMPERFASKHDRYLADYARTGVKKIIGTGQRLQALKKNGEEMDVFLSVGEVLIGDRTWYTGFIDDLTDRVKMERMIDRDKKFMEAVVSTISAGVVVIDEKGVVDKYNQSAARIFGYTENEVLNCNVKMLMPIRYAKHHDKYIEKYLKTGKAAIIGNPEGRGNLQGLRKDGSEVHVHLAVADVMIDGKHVFVGFVTDVTLKKQQEQQMADEEKFNQAVLTTTVSGVVVADHKGTMMKFNRAASNIFGYMPEEVIGQNLKVLMPERYAKNHDNILATYAKTRIKKLIGIGRQVQGLRKDGSEVELQLSVGEVFIDDEVYFTGFLDDITKRVQADKDLFRGAQFAQAVVDSATSGVIVINDKGVVSKFNKAAERIFKYTAEDVINKNVSLLMPAKYAANHDSYISTFLRTGEKKMIGVEGGRQLPGRRSDNTEVQLQLEVSELYIDGSAFFTGFVTDITEKLASQESFKNEQKFNKAVADTSTSAIFVIDTLGSVIQYNKAAIKIFGYSEEEVIGANIKMLMPEPFHSEHDDYLANYAQTGVKKMIGSTGRVVKGLTKSGQELDLQISVGEVTVGDQLLYTGFLEDVTVVMAAATRMEREKNLADSVFETSSAAVVVANHVGKIAKFNPAAEKIFGFGAQEMIGQNVTLLMPERYAKNHDRYLSVYAKTGEKKIIGIGKVVQGKRRTGEEVELHLSVSEAVVDKKVWFTAFLTDMSEEDDGQQELVVQHQALNQLLKSVPEAVIVIDSNGIMRLFNGTAERLFGYAESEALGQNVSMLMPSRVSRRHDQFLAKYKDTGNKRIMDTTSQQTAMSKSKKEFPIDLTLSETEVDDDIFYIGIIKAK